MNRKNSRWNWGKFSTLALDQPDFVQIKEINLYTAGDSGRAKTWSNVPYYFSEQLIRQGIHVNRINIGENKLLQSLYRYSIYPLIRLFYPASRHHYFRSRINHYFTEARIRKAIAQFPKADLQVFMTFSFSSSHLSSKPCVLLGDWTYLYLIEVLQKRKAFWFEVPALKREADNIAKASLAISLFPLSRRFINKHHKTKKCLYLGNVVNSQIPADMELLLKRKRISRKILFIGNQKYLSAAKQLISAFEMLPDAIKNESELHIVGLEQSHIGESRAGVFAHGYLEKDDVGQAELYYELLFSARMIVNSSEGWAAFSSLTEAMFYGTPVICHAFEEFTETYGSDTGLGYYLQKNTATELRDMIEKLLLLNEQEYTAMMEKARNLTSSFTWENYCKAFIAEASKLNDQAI